MTTKELDKLIYEELKGLLSEAEDDDIEISTDEESDDALSILKQIYNLTKDVVDSEGEDEEEEGGEEGEEEEGEDEMDFELGDEEEEEKGEEEEGEEEEVDELFLNEGKNLVNRFKKLANIL